MRPHNKSTLWDEYLEHYDKHKKYFNTKHKKAFCKRCIYKTVDNLDGSTEARAKFAATGFNAEWNQWKLHQGRSMFIPISLKADLWSHHRPGSECVLTIPLAVHSL
jgi:hypothetical protein